MLTKQIVMKKAANIKLAIFDLDGVLTDGTLFYTDSGMHLKAFHAHDGFGLKLLQKAGIELAIITGHQSEVIDRRMQALDIQHVYQGQQDKREAYADLLEKLNLSSDAVCYTGDDLPDLPLIQQSGLGFTVANAGDFIKTHADWHTQASGGHGAVREICELILQAQDHLCRLQTEYLIPCG